MDLLPLLVSLGSGAVGGNLAGKLMPKKSLGTIGNSIVGILGGGIGGQLLGMIGISTGGGMDVAGILGTMASGGVGGGVLLLIVSFIRGILKK